MQTIKCETPEELPTIAEKLIQTFPGQRIFALHAEMGTGKTTFMQAVCSCLGSSVNTFQIFCADFHCGMFYGHHINMSR